MGALVRGLIRWGCETMRAADGWMITEEEEEGGTEEEEEEEEIKIGNEEEGGREEEEEKEIEK